MPMIMPEDGDAVAAVERVIAEFVLEVEPNLNDEEAMLYAVNLRRHLSQARIGFDVPREVVYPELADPFEAGSR